MYASTYVRVRDRVCVREREKEREGEREREREREREGGREKERERERERGRVGYNEAAGKKFVITGATDIMNSGYNESLLNVPGDSL